MKARILLIDIETSPMLGYVWGLFQQNIGLNQLYKDRFILSFSAKGKVKRLKCRLCHSNYTIGKNNIKSS